jgi:hypothetical protein
MAVVNGTLMTLMDMISYDFKMPHPKSLSQGDGLWAFRLIGVEMKTEILEKL